MIPHGVHLSILNTRQTRPMIEDRCAQILLIDDSRGDAILAAHAFRGAKLAAELAVAVSGEDAVARLRSREPLPHLIMLDLQLPKMSGLEVLRTIKTDEHLKHIPVIVLSNSGDEHNITRCYRLYANAYIIKPVDLASYCDAVRLIERFYFHLATLAVTKNS